MRADEESKLSDRLPAGYQPVPNMHVPLMRWQVSLRGFVVNSHYVPLPESMNDGRAQFARIKCGPDLQTRNPASPRDKEEPKSIWFVCVDVSDRSDQAALSTVSNVVCGILIGWAADLCPGNDFMAQWLYISGE